MKTKLIFLTETRDLEKWTNIEFIPRIHEWLNLIDILSTDEKESIKESAKCWSGIRGSIESVEYRYNDNEFYVEVYVLCKD